MTIPADLCNRALDAVGARANITDLTDQSQQAKACNRIYTSTRDELLSQAWWGFARGVTSGTLLKSRTAQSWDTTQPEPPWTFEYAYPDDAIQVRYVSGDSLPSPSVPIFAVDLYGPAPNSPARFIIANDIISGSQAAVILTDQPNATICYTRRVTNEDLWPEQFRAAMVFGLAAYLAIPLTGDKKLAQMMAQQAQAKCNDAQVSDGLEALTIQEYIPDSLRVRGIGDAFFGRIS